MTDSCQQGEVQQLFSNIKYKPSLIVIHSNNLDNIMHAAKKKTCCKDQKCLELCK